MRERMEQARDMIKEGQYTQARAVLKTIEHPKAREWLAKIDELEANNLDDLGDPFAVKPPVWTAKQVAPTMPGSRPPEPDNSPSAPSGMWPQRDFRGAKVPSRQEPIATPESLVARSKSYTSAAVIVLVLYCLLWLPGLIANVMYLNDAKRTEALAGHELPGVGALHLERTVFATIPIILVLIGGVFFLIILLIGRH